MKDALFMIPAPQHPFAKIFPAESPLHYPLQPLATSPYKKNIFSPLTFPVLFLLFPAVVFHRCKLCENREIFPALVGRTQEVFLS